MQPFFRASVLKDSALWVGFSGGLDSTVLLHLLAQNKEVRSRLRVLYVHHGLSVNAEHWQQHCQHICDQWQLPFWVEKVHLARKDAGVEEAARIARYQVYEKYVQAQDYLLLGHHADDQLETVMMRFLRGSGVAGLAGMPSTRHLKSGAVLLRPLLQATRDQLFLYAKKHCLSWVEDESNLEDVYERNFWRNQILSNVWQRFPFRKPAALRTIQQLSNDAQVLKLLLAPQVASVQSPWPWPYCLPRACDTNVLLSQPEELQPYLIKGWLEELGLNVPSQEWLEEVFRSVIAAREDARPHMVIGNYHLFRHRQYLFVTHIMLNPSSDLVVEEGSYVWCGELLTLWVDKKGLIPQEYQVVSAEQCYSLKLKMVNRPSKSVKNILKEVGVPAELRSKWPILCRKEQVCAIAGVAIDERYEQAAGLAVNFSSLKYAEK